MADKHLAIYLNDHLSGSVMALELLDHLQAVYANNAVARVLSELKVEILSDRHELERLMARWTISASRPRKAAAWLTEKLSELKLRIDDPPGGALHLLEALEALAIGIHGKAALWRALATAAPEGPLQAEFARLGQRAEEQRQRVENARLDAVRTALAPGFARAMEIAAGFRQGL